VNKIYLIIGWLLASSCYAQEIIDTVETELPCYNTVEIFKSLKENYKEFPFMTGRASDFANSIVSIWMNPSDGNWTIITTKKDITCVVGMGTDMKIVPYKKGTNL
jgi:hypothetical protein